MKSFLVPSPSPRRKSPLSYGFFLYTLSTCSVLLHPTSFLVAAISATGAAPCDYTTRWESVRLAFTDLLASFDPATAMADVLAMTLTDPSLGLLKNTRTGEENDW